MWNSFIEKIIVTYKRNDFEKKTTFIQAICNNFEKRRADFFKITQM